MLQTMIEAAYVCAAAGRMCIMEHPRKHELSHLPSVWGLPEVRALRGFVGKGLCRAVRMCNVDQCMCGARSRKPTTLLLVNAEPL